MRIFLIMSVFLMAFSVQARQHPALTAEETVPPQFADKNVETKVQDHTKEKSNHHIRSKQPTAQPQQIKMTPQRHSEKSAEKANKHNHEKTNFEHRTGKFDHNHKDDKRHSEKRRKSNVRVNININRPHVRTVSESVIVTQPVTVVRPVVYNNDIYADNAYSCGERSDVKYCTDYLGRPLNGRVVQNYGEDVAYENYQHGYQHGMTTIFSSQGVLVRKTNYKKSLKDGREYIYYETGKTEYMAEYKKGELHGKVVQYDPNGKIIGRMTFYRGHLRTRKCTYTTEDPIVLERVKQKNYNELILCRYGY